MLADSSVCAIPVTGYYWQAYTTSAVVWFNITLEEGTAFVINSTACSTYLGQVLNNCAPYTASSLDDLYKYGGYAMVSNGTGGVARFGIHLTSMD